MTPRDALDMFRRKGGARCVEIGRQIQTFLDGGLDQAAAAKVSNPLAACRRCGLSADDYLRLKDRRLLHYVQEPYRRYQARVPGYPFMPAGPLARRKALVLIARGNRQAV